MIAKNTICLWFDKNAHEAARFYAATFPNSEVTAVHRAPGDFPSGKQGEELTVEFTVLGIPCLGLNGVPRSSTARPFLSRSRRTIKKRPIAIGTPSWAMGGRQASVAGVRIAGEFPGKSHRAR